MEPSSPSIDRSESEQQNPSESSPSLPRSGDDLLNTLTAEIAYLRSHPEELEEIKRAVERSGVIQLVREIVGGIVHVDASEPGPAQPSTLKGSDVVRIVRECLAELGYVAFYNVAIIERVFTTYRERESAPRSESL